MEKLNTDVNILNFGTSSSSYYYEDFFYIMHVILIYFSTRPDHIMLLSVSEQHNECLIACYQVLRSNIHSNQNLLLHNRLNLTLVILSS